MPRYDYECSRCDVVEEYWFSFDEKPEILKCLECGKTMKQIFSSTPAHFKGTGWGGDK